ncbi:MAG: hypothetical protein ACKVOT_06260 [Polaromonas sp.]
MSQPGNMQVAPSGPWPALEGAMDPGASLRHAVSVMACYLFLGFQVFGGVIRWLLDLSGASFAIYLPNVLMLCCILLSQTCDALRQRTSPAVVLFALLLLLCAATGYLNTGKGAQVAFGVWVLVPFFFGLACAPVLLSPGRFGLTALSLLFCLAAGGVVLHAVAELPWVGVNYSIGGVEVEGARDWQTSSGAQRLSGFGRTSFDVGGQLLLLGGLLALHARSVFLRALLWLLAIGAIYLSTSKGSLLSLLMTAVAVEAVVRQSRLALTGIVALGVLWMLVPPVLGWTLDWTYAARTDINHPIFGSFIDRMNDMWPRAWQLAFDHGLPLLGRGLGGIGVPVSVFEPRLENAGDNLFVYCGVLMGVLVVPVFAVGFTALFRLCARLDVGIARHALVMAVAVLWYGGVSNILEHAILGLGFGMVCRVLNAELSSGDVSHASKAGVDKGAPTHTTVCEPFPPPVG